MRMNEAKNATIQRQRIRVPIPPLPLSIDPRPGTSKEATTATAGLFGWI